MDNILKVKSMSLWIFIVPFFAINACLILITQFHGLFPNPEHILHDTILITAATHLHRSVVVPH